MLKERPPTNDQRPTEYGGGAPRTHFVLGPWASVYRRSLWTALLLLAIYLLTTGAQPFISDGEVMLINAMRIVDEHTVSLPEAASTYPQTVRRPDGYVFSRYGLGQPLAAAPLYAIGRYGIGVALRLGDAAFFVGRFCALLLPALATAATGGLLCAWATRLYASARMGVALALLYGIGTLAWPYSRFFFSEALFTACLVLAGLAIATRHPLLAGVALGYAVLTRVGAVVLLPAFLLYLWLTASDDQRPRAEGQRPLGRTWSMVVRPYAWMALGGLPFALLALGYNWVRFRAIGEQGYAGEGFTGNLLVGLYGLLLSPGKSVFLYTPLLLALPWAARPFARRYPPEAALIGALTMITLLQSGLWWIWWAGWGWGPRFLVPLMPFLTLMLGALLERRAWRSIIGLALLPLSIFVNLLGILVDFNVYIRELTRGEIGREAIYLYQPAYSPILEHIRRFDPGSVPIVSFALSSPQIGFPAPWAAALSASFAMLLIVAASGLWHSVQRTKTKN